MRSRRFKGDLSAAERVIKGMAITMRKKYRWRRAGSLGILVDIYKN